MQGNFSKTQRVCLESWNQFYPRRQREKDSQREYLTLFRLIKQQLYKTVKRLDLLNTVKVSASMEFFIYLEYPDKKDFIITISIHRESEDMPLEISLNESNFGKFSVSAGCEKIIELIRQS